MLELLLPTAVASTLALFGWIGAKSSRFFVQGLTEQAEFRTTINLSLDMIGNELKTFRTDIKDSMEEDRKAAEKLRQEFRELFEFHNTRITKIEHSCVRQEERLIMLERLVKINSPTYNLPARKTDIRKS